MTVRSKRTLAVILICLLTLGGLLSAYQTLFDLWMTAYPYAAPGPWATRLYVRLGTTIVIAVLWTLLFIWLFKRKRTNSGAIRNGGTAS